MTKHNIRSGFGKRNCVGVQWTTQRTQVLSINGLPAIEVEEIELGVPVMVPLGIWTISLYSAGMKMTIYITSKKYLPGCNISV